MGSRTRLILGSLLLVSLSLAGCAQGSDDPKGGGTGDAARPYRISFANASEAGGLDTLIGDGVRDAAKVAGIDLKSYNNIPDLSKPDPAQTLANAQLMIQDKPDLIIEYNGIQSIGAALGRQFDNAGVPCIAVNEPVPGCHLFNLSNKLIGTDAANIVADLMDERGWTGDNTTVLMLHAAIAGTEVNDSVRYFYTTLSESVPGFEPAEPEDITAQTTRIGETGLQLDGGAALQVSYNAVKTALQTIPEDRNLVVFGVNDDSVAGGWRAIEEAGRGDKALVGGLGSSPQARKELRENPSWVVEGEVFPGDWGQYVIAMAVAILQGAEPPELTPTPQVVMTKDSVDEFFEVGGESPLALPPLLSDQEYLVSTGILQKFDNIEGLSD